MAKYELRMPKMGESVFEATVLEWHKNEGDLVSAEDIIIEVATDKVDSEIPSPVDGRLEKIIAQKDDVVKVGQVIAIIDREKQDSDDLEELESISVPKEEEYKTEFSVQSQDSVDKDSLVSDQGKAGTDYEKVALSPLVRNIAKNEGLSNSELQSIPGSGWHGRITKDDVFNYLSEKDKAGLSDTSTGREALDNESNRASVGKIRSETIALDRGDTLVELSRMQRIAAEHMAHSRFTAPHATSFVVADVTEAFDWREQHKLLFQQKHGVKLTFTSILIEAIVEACRLHPEVNSVFENEKWILKGSINIGMATALENGDLIVPVLRDVDQLNIVGIAKKVDALSNKARNNALVADDVKGAGLTVSNIGTFGNLTGIPIINRPQTALLAAGAVRKVPAVVETDHGDLIAIRKQMILSLSFDHRVINGYKGGSFLKAVADHIEQFDANRSI